MNHFDLFLYFNENSFLITYKLPKNTKNSYGIRQKDHRLKYLSYEGNINENENLQIEKRGYCITHNWVFTNPENNYAKITFEEINGSMENMWKKTDFKIALDEIVLYEVNDEKHIQTDKHISSRIVENIPDESTTEPEPELTEPDVIESEIPQPIASQSEVPEPVITETEKPEIPAAPEPVEKITPKEETAENTIEKPDQQTEPVEMETEVISASDEAAQHVEVPKNVLQPEIEISFAPIKEMVLSPDGKSEEEYNPST